MRILLVSAAILAAAGCGTPQYATINGHQVARPTLGYTDGRYYAVMHSGAYPSTRGASSGIHDYAGHLTGTVCGEDIFLEADYRRNHILVNGYVRSARFSVATSTSTAPAHFEVRDDHGARRIVGSVGDSIGEILPTGQGDGPGHSPALWINSTHSHGIDFSITGDWLKGTIGPRDYDLHRGANDEMIGTVRMNGKTRPFVLRGVSSVWSMPAPDQAAILPLMMTCTHGEPAYVRPDGEYTPMMMVDFSGETADDPYANLNID